MTYEEAKKILDHIRCGEGQQFGETTINCALNVTGDLDFHARVGGQGVDSPVQEEGWRGRCRERAILVGTNKKGYRQSPWRREFAFAVEADGAGTC